MNLGYCFNDCLMWMVGKMCFKEPVSRGKTTVGKYTSTNALQLRAEGAPITEVDRECHSFSPQISSR